MDKAVFNVGDIIRVTTQDFNNKKVHGTPFEGIVIARKGIGENKSMIVRKVSQGKIAVERIFPLNSPSIQDIRLIKKGDTRRAKLYFLRNRLNK